MSFVERRLELTTGEEVLVCFLQPEETEYNWRCEYRIEWPDRQRCFYGFGIDAVQALYIAMCMAHADLLSSAESKAGTLRWLGQRDFGLPVAHVP
jgi:Domain of unknown function (DUF6968)